MKHIKIDEVSLVGIENLTSQTVCVTLVNSRRLPVSSDFIVKEILHKNECQNLTRIVLEMSSMLTGLEAFSNFRNLASLSIETASVTDVSSLLCIKSLKSAEFVKNKDADYSLFRGSGIFELGIDSPTEKQLVDIGNLNGVKNLAVQNVDFKLIPLALAEKVCRLSIIKGQGNMLDLKMAANLTELQLYSCGKLGKVMLPAGLAKLRVEHCKRLAIEKIEGGSLSCLVLQNIAPIGDWSELLKWPRLERIAVSGTRAKKLDIRSLCCLDGLKEISAPPVRMTEEEVCELSKIGQGILLSAGGYIYRNGRVLRYWDGSKEIL